MNTRLTPPETLWLQFYEDEAPSDAAPLSPREDLADVTWSADEAQYPHDVKYVRADIVDAVRQERDACDLAFLASRDETEREQERNHKLESQVEVLSRTLRTVKELIRPPHTYVQDIDLINASKEIEKALREQS